MNFILFASICEFSHQLIIQPYFKYVYYYLNHFCIVMITTLIIDCLFETQD